ncbi:MAG: oxidoreductase [Polaromonas sp.]|nr:oxidoreductase [Polaromonas sp.]
MGFFSNILEKLGMTDAAAATASATATAPVAPAASPAPATSPVAAAPAAPVVNPIAMVDVVALLTEKAAKHPEKLNWKTSIVDLLKLLGLDSSLAARKELAKELYCPDDKMADSAQMNMWLHKNVLGHIAANGGNIPKELL